MTSIQKCFRTVDIDEVGDESHCTFFEMLGNFSVGDYFKRGRNPARLGDGHRPIQSAHERIWITVHPDDDVARTIWRDEIGIPADRIQETLKNFWGPVGDTGPCGPNSEIYYDRLYDAIAISRVARWAQRSNATSSSGTSCSWSSTRGRRGARRRFQARTSIQAWVWSASAWCFRMQNRSTILICTSQSSSVPPASRVWSTRVDPNVDRSLRIIGDHTRAVAFLIADGVLPGNEGRGYVLRRVLRQGSSPRTLTRDRGCVPGRADRCCHRELLRPVSGAAANASNTSMRIVNAEEEAFSRTLATGMTRFETLVEGLKSSGNTIIPGDEAFRLHEPMASRLT